MSLKKIADDLGFADPYQFSRRFKQIVGISPSIYRDQVLEGSRANWSRLDFFTCDLAADLR